MRSGPNFPILIAGVEAFLPALEAHAVDRARTRLVQDPPENGAASGLVPRRMSPNVVEDVDRELFRGLPVAGDAHRQRENGPARSIVECVKGNLISGRDSVDEVRPLPLGSRCAVFAGIEHSREGAWPAAQRAAVRLTAHRRGL